MIIPIPKCMKNPKKEEKNRQLRKENFCKKANSPLAKRVSEYNLNYKNYEISLLYIVIIVFNYIPHLLI